MNTTQLKILRNGLLHAKEEINGDWEKLGIDYQHWLAESLAALVIEIDENIDNVNQIIGELS